MKSLKIVYFEDNIEIFEITKDMLQEFEIQLICVPRNERNLSEINNLNTNIVLIENRLSTREY